MLFSGFSMSLGKDQNPQHELRSPIWLVWPQTSLFLVCFFALWTLAILLLLVFPGLRSSHAWLWTYWSCLDSPLTHSYLLILSWLRSSNLLYLGSDIKQAFFWSSHLTRCSFITSHNTFNISFYNNILFVMTIWESLMSSTFTKSCAPRSFI